MSNRKGYYYSELELSCSKIYGHSGFASHIMKEDGLINVQSKTPTRKVSNYKF